MPPTWPPPSCWSRTAAFAKAAGAVDVPGDGEGTYYVAHEPHPTYADLGRMVGKAVGRPSVHVLNPPRALVGLAALAGELVGHVRGKAGLMNFDKFREVRAGWWTCDTTRIRTTLGFSPQRTLDQRLQQTADWYRREGWL